MKRFDSPSAVIEAPDDWLDGSTYTIYGPPLGGGRPSLVVAMTRFVPEGGAPAYVDQQLPELGKLPLFQRERLERIAESQGVLLQFTWKQPAGPILRVRQWYLVVHKVLFNLTATAPAAVFTDQEAGLEQMVRTFRPKSW